MYKNLASKSVPKERKYEGLYEEEKKGFSASNAGDNAKDEITARKKKLGIRGRKTRFA